MYFFFINPKFIHHLLTNHSQNQFVYIWTSISNNNRGIDSLTVYDQHIDILAVYLLICAEITYLLSNSCVEGLLLLSHPHKTHQLCLGREASRCDTRHPQSSYLVSASVWLTAPTPAETNWTKPAKQQCLPEANHTCKMQCNFEQNKYFLICLWG